MLKCQSELFQPSLKLVDGLEDEYKRGIKEDGENFGFYLFLPSCTRMSITLFCRSCLTCPEMWLSRLTHYELALLDKLVERIW